MYRIISGRKAFDDASVLSVFDETIKVIHSNKEQERRKEVPLPDISGSLNSLLPVDNDGVTDCRNTIIYLVNPFFFEVFLSQYK